MLTHCGACCDDVTRSRYALSLCVICAICAMRHSHAGTYFVTSRCVVDNLRGTPTSHIVIAAYGDGPVVVDGTVELSNTAWTKTASNHYSTPSNGHDILQLFVDRSLQVVARYPNAKWSDKSVFYAVENWFRSQVPGKHDVETGEGSLLDQGACDDMRLCCGYEPLSHRHSAVFTAALFHMLRCAVSFRRGVTHLLTHVAGCATPTTSRRAVSTPLAQWR